MINSFFDVYVIGIDIDNNDFECKYKVSSVIFSILDNILCFTLFYTDGNSCIFECNKFTIEF